MVIGNGGCGVIVLLVCLDPNGTLMSAVSTCTYPYYGEFRVPMVCVTLLQ